MTRILRFVLFSQSIISDIGNPQATTVRAMCQALIALGHDVTHIEPRGNEHLTRLLQIRGYAPMRALNERYPMLRYKQYDPSGGIARRIWFSREIGTADAVIAYPDCNEDVISEVTDLNSQRIVTFRADQKSVPSEMRDACFQPAVLGAARSVERIRRLSVAYDSEVQSASGDDQITCGLFDQPRWRFVPEVNMAEIYQTAEHVRMNSADVAGAGFARALLPVANGAVVTLTGEDGSLVRSIDNVPAANDAGIRAGRLVAYIDEVLGQRYVLPG